MSILQDVKTVIKLTGEIRKARKSGGCVVEIRQARSMQIAALKPAWLNTVEGCQVWNFDRDINQTVSEVYYSFPREVQRQLEYTPEEPGGWVERARFWQQQLRPVLPEKEYHAIMALFVGWYAHCLKMRKEAAI